VLQAALYATGSIVVQCTLGDTFTIALNGGSTTGTITNREMVIQGGGSSVVHYGLYTSASYATTWGDGVTGGSTVGAATTGANQTFVVYGQVPAQSTPTAGAYADTVTATITY
jgi:spore coat protein U-like protein